MKKILLSVAAVFAAMSLNAQEVCTFNTDNALELDADNGTTLNAGTVIGETTSIVATIGADDPYKPQDVKFTVNGTEYAGGLQGSNNPKDADSGTPSSTLVQPASGAFLQFEAKADGFLYVIHKASSNKAYTVFEEGSAVGYTFAAIGNKEPLPEVYQFTIEGGGEYNYLSETDRTNIEFAEQEWLKVNNAEFYESNFAAQDDGTTKWTAISAGGIGVIKFAVAKDCKYIVNANGSKITAGGFVFSTEDNVLIQSGDVVIYKGEGAAAPTPAGDANVIWEGDGSAGEVNWNGIYRFANEEKVTGEEIAAIPMDVWEKLKTTPFYVDLTGATPQIRVTTGWWDTNLTADDIQPGNELLTDNGDGTWTVKVDLSGAADLLALLDDHHLLFTGSGYTPTKIYFAEGGDEPAPEPGDEPGEGGAVLVAEKDWTGGFEGDYWMWYQFADGQEGTVTSDPEGVAITVGSQTGELWQPQVTVLNEGLTLEEDHSYVVKVTAKFPTDGTLQINMGNWDGRDQYTTDVTATGDFQEVEVLFEGYAYNVDGNGFVLFQCGDFLGTTIVKKVEVWDITEGEIPDAIQTVKKTVADGAIYNLAGQKVNASYKGVVIKNGKKYFQK